MSHRWTWSRSLCAAALLVSLAASGCTWVGDDTDPNKNPANGGSATLRRFASAQEMVDFVRGQLTSQRTLFDLLPVAAPSEAGGVATNDANADASYSTTNVQEGGVDESDVVKSDGQYLYVARGRTIHIVHADPSTDLAEAATLQLDGIATELYLHGHTLIVLGGVLQDTPPIFDDGPVLMGFRGGVPVADTMIWPPYHLAAKVAVTAIDISNPTSPQVVKTTTIDGSLAASRLIGDRLHLVLTYMPDVQPLTGFFGGFAGAEVVLPTATIGNAASPLIAWDDVYRPDSPMGYTTTTIVTLDAGDISNIVGKVGVMADAGTLYASQQALYLTSPQWWTPSGGTRTIIHKFAFDANGAAQYVASGQVPGTMLNQFSLGELNGYLRVATHSSAAISITPVAFSDGSSSASSGVASSDAVSTSTNDAASDAGNGVYVLGVNGESLDVVGKLEGIEPTEKLYSARFIGNRGYLVTFRQIDPLFTIDLTDPTKPTLGGELKIPGYSDYLHPFGDTLLLGIGRSTQTSQWGGVRPFALQLSLFNVADASNPTLVQQIEVGGDGSVSDVSYTHKAFTLKPGGTTFAISATLFPGGDPSDPKTYVPNFQGSLIYAVSDSGITPTGSLAAITQASDQVDWSAWRRSAFIGDSAFSISDKGVRRAGLGDLTTSTELTYTTSP